MSIPQLTNAAKLTAAAVLEAGGLGAGNSAQNMTVHNTYANVRKDAPFYFNPDGEYAGLNTSGFVEKDNTIVMS